MGSILASTITSDARRRLQDESNVAQRWEDSVLLAGLNEGQSVLVTLKHDACTRAIAVDVTGGVSQTLPEDSVALIRLTRNLGENGDEPGRAITMVSLERMDLADAQWHVADTGDEVFHGMFDERDERRFYVWPPINGYVELIATVLPPEVEVSGDAITLDDIYSPALTAYIVYYALAQDMDSAPNRELAQVWLAQFVQLVSGKMTSEDVLGRG
jgi:Family of unknown function (DUF6682)